MIHTVSTIKNPAIDPVIRLNSGFRLHYCNLDFKTETGSLFNKGFATGLNSIGSDIIDPVLQHPDTDSWA
jgi:hypothetical protein